MCDCLFVTLNGKKYLRMSTTVSQESLYGQRRDYMERGIIVRTIESFHMGGFFTKGFVVVECLVPMNQVEWFGELR